MEDDQDGYPRLGLAKARSGGYGGRVYAQVTNEAMQGSMAMSLDDGETLPKYQWIHLAAVFDHENSLLTLYLDGDVQDSVPLVTFDMAVATDLGLHLGRSFLYGAGSYGWHKGLLDEVRIYDRALSAPEVGALYAGGGGNQIEIDAQLNCGTYLSGVPVSLTAGDWQLTVVNNPNDHFDAWSLWSSDSNPACTPHCWRWEVSVTVPGVLDLWQWNPTGQGYATQQAAIQANEGMSTTFTLDDDATVYFWAEDSGCGDNRGGMTLELTSGGSEPGAPVADAGGPYSGTVGEHIQFDASASYDTDGTIETYEWQWSVGDSWHDEGAYPTHAYADPDTYTVTLRVTDDDGATDDATAAVVVGPPANQPPVAYIDDTESLLDSGS